MKSRVKRKLDDQHISALVDFQQFGIYWDTVAPGLRLRVGPRKVTWQFFAEHSVHGRRSTTHKTLGFYPNMGTIAARKMALIEAGRVAAKNLTPGRRVAVRLGPALDDYLKFLRGQSARGGRGAKPRIIEVAVPMNATRHGYSAGNAVVATFGRSLGSIPSKFAFDLYVKQPLPPGAVLAVHTEGDALFVDMGHGYPAGFIDVDIGR